MGINFLKSLGVDCIIFFYNIIVRLKTVTMKAKKWLGIIVKAECERRKGKGGWWAVGCELQALSVEWSAKITHCGPGAVWIEF